MWTLAFSFFFQTELYFILLLVTLAGPNLISLDLRYNALPLYLSRPVTRLDYFLGKLGVIAALVAAVAVLPAAAAYVLGVCFSLDLTVLRDTWRLLPAGIAYGSLIVVSAGTLMLALSSLSRRSLYVGLTWIGLFLIGWTVAGRLGRIHHESLEREAEREAEVADRAQAEYERQQTLGHRPAWPQGPDQADFAQTPDERDFAQTPEEREFAGTRDESEAREVPPQDPSAFPSPQRSAPSRRFDWQQRQRQVEQAEARSGKTDWRPLFSYTANLYRLGEAILNTDAAWVQIGRAYERGGGPNSKRCPAGRWGRSQAADNPEPVNERRLADSRVPQYPWTWSAGVLAGLFGLSLCILCTRVKSLDRLR